MRICIFGAGSMGTVLGAYLSRAGIHVDLVSRNKEHIAALKANGAHIVGKVDFVQPVSAFLPEEMEGQYDIILLMTKLLDNRSVVRKLVPFLEDDGVICTMQNGLPELSVASVIGEERTIGCAMAWGATLLGGGVSELTTEPSRETLSFAIGAYGSVPKEKVTKLASVLAIMGDVTIEENFLGARWAKLMVNAAFSGLSAALNATFGEIAENHRTRLLALKIVKECIDVTKKENIKVEPIQGKDIVKLLDYHTAFKRWISFMIIPIAMRRHHDLKSSMLQDLEKGKKCEIEAINGVVCEYGDKVGVDTPLNDLVVKVVREIENGDYKPSWDNLARFQAFLER